MKKDKKAEIWTVGHISDQGWTYWKCPVCKNEIDPDRLVGHGDKGLECPTCGFLGKA